MILSSAHFLEVVLIERVPEVGRALFEADGVDPRDAVEVSAQVRVGGLAAEQRQGVLPGGRLGGQVAASHELSSRSMWFMRRRPAGRWRCLRR